LGATVFPTPLGLAATFHEDLIESVSNVIGKDLKASGVHHALSPVLDLVRDYHWGRVEETMGEDPYLSAVAGSAYVRGIQKNGVVATLKHFAGHSFSRAARNHGPVAMGWREMYDFILPPFELAIRESKVGSVMNSYTDVDGLPCAASVKMMTTILHDELGFDGVVVSDYWAIAFLEHMHRVAGSKAEAGALALKAGIDVELPNTGCYGAPLIEAVNTGVLEESYIDRACRRVLLQKLDQGLLDPGWNQEKDISKNIAIVGPCGDDGSAFLGCYSFPNHVMAMENLNLGIEVPTFKSALQKALPDCEITFAPGVPVKEIDTGGISAARKIVDSAELAFVVVGDRAGLFGRGTSGEGNDVADLKLPGSQAEMLDEMLRSQTPIIIISVSGRPYAFGDFIERAAGMIQAFMPGEEGGTALAEIITGKYSPSGRLPVEIPSTISGQPSTYLEPHYGQPGLGMSPVDSIPLFGFGYGLTYMKFAYSDFTISSTKVATDGEFTVKLKVKNIGARTGVEVVQLYFDDPVAEVARPIIKLLGFARIQLDSGEEKEITFTVHTDRLAYCGADYDRIVDSGEIKLSVGSARNRLHSTQTINLKGERRLVPFNRVLRTAVKTS
jgi:beta-glucosidase